MLRPFYSSRFKRDVRQAERRGKDMEKLRNALTLLTSGEILPERYRDHPLQGKWAGHRDAHIEPDWLLLYSIVGDTIRFERTGRHADLFDE